MATTPLSQRDARTVFEDHLELARAGDLETDIARNCAADIVLLTNYGTFRGHVGVREAAALLRRQLPDGQYDYRIVTCHDRMCFLHWTGAAESAHIPDGADSFLIERGKIRVQTIYYTVRRAGK